MAEKDRKNATRQEKSPHTGRTGSQPIGTSHLSLRTIHAVEASRPITFREHTCPQMKKITHFLTVQTLSPSKILWGCGGCDTKIVQLPDFCVILLWYFWHGFTDSTFLLLGFCRIWGLSNSRVWLTQRRAYHLIQVWPSWTETAFEFLSAGRFSSFC